MHNKVIGARCPKCRGRKCVCEPFKIIEPVNYTPPVDRYDVVNNSLNSHRNSDDHDGRYALKSEAKSLEQRLDLIVKGSTNAEVVDARKDMSGTFRATVGERISADIGRVNEQLVKKASQVEVISSLNLKRDKTTKIEPEDASERLLNLVTGQGTINLLSIPQADSVSMKTIKDEVKYGILDLDKSPLKHGVKRLLMSAWELGSISGSNGENEISVARLRTTDYIVPTEDNAEMRLFDTNYKYYYVRYDSSNNIIDSVSWISNKTVEKLVVGSKYRFVFSKQNDVALTNEELLNMNNVAIFVEGESFILKSDKTSELANAIIKSPLLEGGKKYLDDLKWRNGTSWSGGVVSDSIYRIFSDGFINPSEEFQIKLLNNSYRYAIFYYEQDGTFINDSGWKTDARFIIPHNPLLKYKIQIAKVNENTQEVLDIPTTLNNFIFLEGIFSINENLLSSGVQQKLNNIKSSAMNSIDIEYGRIKNASYVFIRIPRILNDGSRIIPKVELTSRDGSLSGAKRSALQYARDNDSIFTINAGLFNVTTNQPVGQTIINGVSVVNTPMIDDNGVPIHPEECYPLAIDSDYNLTTYPRNADTSQMILDGIRYAITGWGRLVTNFQIDEVEIAKEIVHGNKKYIRQSIGQFQNGDYCVCTVDQARGTVQNEDGLYYQDLAQLLVDRGVKFAYSLDGGGSAETVIGKRQLNPIYEGSTGRAVPTVITFEVV